MLTDSLKLRKLIHKFLLESLLTDWDTELLDEERITNPESAEYVKRRENFIASHIFGEDLGDLGLMYVAYSYNENFPAYVFFDNKWYYNTDDFINDDGTVNEWNKEHMDLMRPTNNAHGVAGSVLKEMIRKFMQKHNIKKIDHTGVEPGTKN